MTSRKEIYCQILLPIKSKMAAVAILKFTLTAVTRVAIQHLHIILQTDSQQRS